ncbi:MAG: hypothetical protein LBJ67_16660 [Planctomycetaceae bacterium]|jgi:hypothetical protein|nr:hypothetical protein [Planctomycetaceae bacterium]
MSSPQEIQEQLIRLIDKTGNGYFVTVANLIKLPAALRKELGIMTKTSGADKQKILQRFLEDKFEFFKKGNSAYLVKKLPGGTDELVLRLVQKNLGKSPGRVTSPLSKLKFYESLNRLNAKGLIYYELNTDGKVKKLLLTDFSQNAQSTASISQNATVSDCMANNIQAFKSLYDRLISGKQMVIIADLRRGLNWDKGIFEKILEQLRREGKIQLMTGDASLMQEEDVRLGYRDANGFDYLILKWKNP